MQEVCISAAAPEADVSRQGLSMASPCPIAYHSRPVLFSAASTTTLWGSALLPVCTVQCSLTTVVPKFFLLCRVMTWRCSLHHPRAIPCVKAGALRSSTRGSSKSCSWGGTIQAPAHVVGCLAGNQPGKSDHAAALEHRLSSHSSRSMLAFLLHLERTPLWQMGAIGSSEPLTTASTTGPHRTSSTGLSLVQPFSAASEPH